MFITRWKVEGELQRLKNITWGIYVPNGSNEGCSEPVLRMRILLKPHQMSSLVKTIADVRAKNNCSMSGSGSGQV